MGPRRFPIALVLLFLFFVIASHGFGPPMAGWWWGGAFFLPRLLFPFLIVAAILYFARPHNTWRARYAGPDAGPAPAHQGPYHGTTPDEILRERFARGEVTRDQYREATVDLLKDRYVRGELTLEEYEARVNVVMGVAREQKSEPKTQEGQQEGQCRLEHKCWLSRAWRRARGYPIG